MHPVSEVWGHVFRRRPRPPKGGALQTGAEFAKHSKQAATNTSTKGRHSKLCGGWTNEVVMSCAKDRDIGLGCTWDTVARTVALSCDGAAFGVVEVRRDSSTDPAILQRKLASQSRAISSLRLALAKAMQRSTADFPNVGQN
jgi:hypothetical protein